MSKKTDGKKSGGNGKGSTKLIDPNAHLMQKAVKAKQQANKKVAKTPSGGIDMASEEFRVTQLTVRFERQAHEEYVRQERKIVEGKAELARQRKERKGVAVELLGSQDRMYLASIVTMNGMWKQ
jgi:hypothetical protein